MKIKIEKTGINGEGIGYLKNKPIFIASTLPQELVEAEITIDKDRYAIAECLRIVEKSPKRIESPCIYQDRCGGCALMITDVAYQEELKISNLKQSLLKYMGKLDFRLIKKIQSNPKPFNYRNQFKHPIKMEKKRLVAGFYKAGTNHFVNISECIVHEDELEKAKFAILNILNKHRCDEFDPPNLQGIRTLIVRSMNEEIQVTLVSGKMTLDEKLVKDLMAIKNVVSLYHSVNTDRHAMDPFGRRLDHIAGKETLDFEFEDLKFSLSPKAFFQLNAHQASLLFKAVTDLIPENKLVVDAYCGIGALSLMMAKKSEKVIGIEFSQEAIDSANLNAKLNRLDNCEFIVGDAAEKLSNLRLRPDVLVIDPPRSGLSDEMIKSMLKLKVKEIVYISCNPSTLAKNLNELKSHYRIRSIQPFDLFTHTPLLETVVHLTLI
jgi:23S rRNA (uracil1939-C5)-methyltransferase